jgi:alkanesulfonate monooxygenase SsuD/methylene tetrahydromethanopterin reductase-like flavin-dependent oxidoreductase (luciferase family)
VRRSVGVVREAARAAGRDPDAFEVTARIMINIDGRSPEGDLVSRRQITGYMNVPVYRQFHTWLGRGEAFAGMWSNWEAGDRRGAVAAIPQDVVDALVVNGTPAERRDHLDRYFEAGVDTAFLSFMSREQDPAARKAKIVQALRDHAPQR